MQEIFQMPFDIHPLLKERLYESFVTDFAIAFLVSYCLKEAPSSMEAIFMSLDWLESSVKILLNAVIDFAALLSKWGSFNK